MSGFFSYLRRYKDPHRGLVMLRPACRMAGVRLHRVTMQPVFVHAAWMGQRIQRLLGKFFGHVCIVPKVIKSRRQVVLVREFLTVPLFVVAPCLWPWRRSIWFLCHHNVGLAVSNKLHRFMLKTMYAAGFRFIVFETPEAWQPIASHVDPSRLTAIPHPLPVLEPSVCRSNASERRLVVGFVGNFRAEKSPLWALEQLARANEAGELSPPVDLLVGTADAAFRTLWKERATVVDTGAHADYLRALESCDVVMLPYDEGAYSYRVSGVLAEAVALGAAVVTPGVPVLRDQVRQPKPIGDCYVERAGFLDSLRKTMAIRRDPGFSDALEAHAKYRSLDHIAAIIARLTAT